MKGLMREILKTCTYMVLFHNKNNIFFLLPFFEFSDLKSTKNSAESNSNSRCSFYLKFCQFTYDQMHCICWLQKQFSDLIPRVLEVIKALALHDEVCILSLIWYDCFVYSFSFTNILTFNWKKHLDVVIYNQEWRWNSNLSHLCPLVHLPHVAVILRWWKINRSNR